MSRPTLSLACILKNEAHNIQPLLQSVKGCFDEIVMVDTGSTDESVKILEMINGHVASGSPDWVGIPKIKIAHFKWVNDFAKARQYSFDQATSDYVMWMDLDDVLSDAQAFIKWRDTVMHSAHYWVAKYNYAYNKHGQVECEFIRERVIKNDYGFGWEYFVHEGLIQKEGRKFWPQRANTWTVNHQRTDEDRKLDHMRNLKIFELNDIDKLHPRMKFYYGKELVENGMSEKAGKPLMEALGSGELDIHDRILSIQYAAQAAFQQKAYISAMDLVTNGIKLKPQRAEFWCLLGDVYQAMGQPQDAVMAYRAARICKPDDLGGIVVVYQHAYWEYPTIKLLEIFINTGAIADAEPLVKELRERGHHEAQNLENKLEYLRDISTVREGLPKTDDVIITCPPGFSVTDWDEGTLKSKGHGGSETAAIEVAKWITKKTKRRVKIYQPRQKRTVMPSGVEYVPVQELQGYLQNFEPKAHIAWRHASKLTPAKSYVWCHDLQCRGAEMTQNYDKIVALSGFHKNYLIETNGVPEDKIVLGFNGINPEDFDVDHGPKNSLKVVFSSSPDRGLVQSIDIVKRAREISKLDIELHCFYGTENMRKMGMADWANSIEQKITDNSFVVYHGMVTKKELMKHFLEAAVWLYPADFIESFCITAWEALAAGVWPIVRDMGALKYTMREAIEQNMCDVLSQEVTDQKSIDIWAATLVDAIREKKYLRVKFEKDAHSWERVADLFVKELSL